MTQNNKSNIEFLNAGFRISIHDVACPEISPQLLILIPVLSLSTLFVFYLIICKDIVDKNLDNRFEFALLALSQALEEEQRLP